MDGHLHHENLEYPNLVQILLIFAVENMVLNPMPSIFCDVYVRKELDIEKNLSGIGVAKFCWIGAKYTC